MKNNSERVVEAAASYIDSLYQQGKNSVQLYTFSGEQCEGTIHQQEISYNPLRVLITLINKKTAERQTFDLSEVSNIQPT
jgi:hypothetical protein